MRNSLILLVAAAAVLAAAPARADRIENPIAVFSGLDKITGRIITFEAAVDETVQFGSLQLTARVCFTRPPTESPNTTSFIEVDELTLDNSVERIFSGWIYASSPGLNAIEHPVYDVWLIDCRSTPLETAQADAGSDTLGAASGELGIPLPPRRPADL